MEPYQSKLQNIISTHFTITDTSREGLEKAAQLVQDIADSFGGCTRCWGAGWLGDIEIYTEFCDCERADVLRKFVANHNAAAH